MPTRVLLRERNQRAQRTGQVKTEAERDVKMEEAKECRCPGSWRKQRNRFPQGLQKERSPAHTLTLAHGN